MMKSVENKILSELRHLVRNAGPEEFLKVSKRRDISDHMKSAMEFLALECLGKSSNLKKSSMTKSYKRTPQRSRLYKRDVTFRSDRTGSKTEADQIYDILINSKRLATKIALTDFAKYIGFHITINTKDSRARAAKKLAKAIASSSEGIKRKTLSMLNEKLDAQTQGWFDIILKK